MIAETIIVEKDIHSYPARDEWVPRFNYIIHVAFHLKKFIISEFISLVVLDKNKPADHWLPAKETNIAVVRECTMKDLIYWMIEHPVAKANLGNIVVFHIDQQGEREIQCWDHLEVFCKKFGNIGFRGEV